MNKKYLNILVIVFSLLTMILAIYNMLTGFQMMQYMELSVSIVLFLQSMIWWNQNRKLAIFNLIVAIFILIVFFIILFC